jgi:hypothetical protein
MKQGWVASFGLLALPLLLCRCATGNSGDENPGMDSGTMHQTEDATASDSSASGSDSSLGQGDTGFHIDSGQMTEGDSAAPVDSEAPPADSGTEGDTGGRADSGPSAESGAAETGAADTGSGDSGTEDAGRDGAGDSGTADSSTEDAPDSHADSATDSGLVDSTVADTGSAAADTSVPVTCQPGTLTGFTATNVQPLNNAGACTTGQISTIVTDCLDPNSTQTTCNNLSNADETCVTACPLFTPYSSTNVTIGMPAPPPMGPWGPFVQVFNPGESDFFNLGACVALADSTQTTCANALTQQFECETYVCAPNCSIPAAPADPTAAENAYNACTTAADGCPASGNGPCTGVCGTFVNSSSTECASVLNGTGPAAFCLNGSLASTTSSTADPSLKKLLDQQCAN